MEGEPLESTAVWAYGVVLLLVAVDLVVGMWTWTETLTDNLLVAALLPLLLVGVFLLWFRASYDNALRLGRGQDLQDLGLDRRWAVFGWLLPGANLLLGPWLAIGLWRASVPLSKRNDGLMMLAGGLLTFAFGLLVLFGVLQAGLAERTKTMSFSHGGPASMSDGSFVWQYTSRAEVTPIVPGGQTTLAFLVLASLVAALYVIGVTRLQAWSEDAARSATPPDPGLA